MAQNQTPWQLTRLLMVTCWVLWILTFFVTVTLFQAVIQIQVVSQVARDLSKGFMSFSDDLSQTVPLSIANTAILDEMMVRYYLEMRYSLLPDQKEMERRWAPSGVVAYLSTPSVFKEFQAQAIDLEKVEGRRPKVVDIIRVERVNNSKQYFVDIDIYEYDGSTRWVKQRKSLTVDYANWTSRVMLNQAFANPNGFIVTRVYEAEVIKK